MWQFTTGNQEAYINGRKLKVTIVSVEDWVSETMGYLQHDHVVRRIMTQTYGNL